MHFWTLQTSAAQEIRHILPDKVRKNRNDKRAVPCGTALLFFGNMVGGAGFEPTKACASRFTVYPS